MTDSAASTAGTPTWTTLDELDEGSAFRKIRQQLGVEAFGVNGIVFPPGTDGFWHFHDEQDELYFVHAGTARFELDGGKEVTLGPGGIMHVPSTTPRRVCNAGDDDLVVIAIGGKGGYVGRDGQLVNMDDLAERQAMSSSATRNAPE